MTAATDNTIETNTVLIIDNIEFNSSSAVVSQIEIASLPPVSVDV
jgi:hypothetical protein